MLAHNVTGGFPDSILAVLHANPGLVFDIAQSILDVRFPPEQHEAILERVGLHRASV